MAYFDSAKNNAMWERRMAGLREERRRRQETGYMPKEQEKAAARQENPFRRRINLEQLEKIEMEALGIRRVKRPVKSAQAEKTMNAVREKAPKGRQL